MSMQADSANGQHAWKKSLQVAQSAALLGQFEVFLKLCQGIVDEQKGSHTALLDVGSMLLSFGFLALARECFAKARTLSRTELRPIFELANVAQQAGAHDECHRLYEALLLMLPDHPVVRRNALLSLEYDPAVSDAERYTRAKAWGEWAIARPGSILPRPAMPKLAERQLRIGYVSADLCQHTVGLFVKDVLAAHDKNRVSVYAYSNGQVEDWVTSAVRQSCVFRDVRALDDVALASQIRQDEIDVLVDLSGHTAGSRLTAFAYRPAPILVSWLGYFATTGLAIIDAVLLDEWHAPSGIESQFSEPVIRLPRGRFCYTPVPFAPEQAAVPPSLAKGYVTFGSFNNTAKLNADVIRIWATVLQGVPDSRLILKWKTFQDEGMRNVVRGAFSKHGIDPARIDLRGASFHVDLLKQYADVDICLDPFPFSGGLTSCEALWMGVPVVTLPQSRVVSRQTYAFLSAIGLNDLAANDGDEYVRIAIGLANDPQRLGELRRDLRALMTASSLCDVKGFTSVLEDAFFTLAREMDVQSSGL